MSILSSLVPECVSSRVCMVPGLVAAPVKMVGDASSVVLGVAASVLALAKFGTDKELNRFANCTTRLHGDYLFTRPYVAALSVFSPEEGEELKAELDKKPDCFEYIRSAVYRCLHHHECAKNLYSISFCSRLSSSQIFDLSVYLAHYRDEEAERETSPQPVSQQLGRFAVREIASRVMYAAATITAIVARSLDLISGLALAIVSLGTGGYFSGLNRFAFMQLQAGAGLAEICMGVRAIFGHVRQFDRLDFLPKMVDSDTPSTEI